MNKAQVLARQVSKSVPKAFMTKQFRIALLKYEQSVHSVENTLTRTMRVVFMFALQL